MKVKQVSINEGRIALILGERQGNDCRVAPVILHKDGKFYNSFSKLDEGTYYLSELPKKYKKVAKKVLKRMKKRYPKLRITLYKSNVPIVLQYDRVLVEAGKESIPEMLKRLAKKQIARYGGDIWNKENPIYYRYVLTNGTDDRVEMNEFPYIIESE